MSEVIPVIPEEEQVPVLATDMLETQPLRDSRVEKVCHKRLEAGHEKYGTSWTEVNLKADLLEELFDLPNYARMIIQRMRAVGREPTYTEYKVLEGVIASAISMINDVYDHIPEFEGPTSQEWVEQQKEDQ